MTDKDYSQRFLFEHRAIRGQFVRLEQSYRDVLETHFYPEVIQNLLGEYLCAATLLSGTIKYDGVLTLQTSGSHNMPVIMAECSSKREVRGIARISQPDTAHNENNSMQQGTLAITITPNEGKRYQGIVSLDGDTLSSGLENYFQQSEQLVTRLWLSSNGASVSGLLIQALPASEQDDREKHEDDWQHVECLANTLSDEELEQLDCETLLRRLFHEEDLRLFSKESVQFACSCSSERTARALLGIGEQEVRDILLEQGKITLNCEFCNQRWDYYQQEVDELFGQQTDPTVH
jgi:molecular chaperone Hsp33